jgi:hypothetical protein
MPTTSQQDAANLRAALTAILPYAESRLEDMAESFGNGECANCTECQQSGTDRCPNLQTAAQAVETAQRLVGIIPESTPGAGLKYTVLLLVPDTLTHTFGQETYLAHVNVNANAATLPPAVGACAVIAEARDAAMTAYAAWDDGIDITDFFVLTVFAGHLENLKPD